MERPEPDNYGAIARYNWEQGECNCPAYGALLCIAVAEGLDLDIADARYGPCDCPCHEQQPSPPSPSSSLVPE